MLMLVVFCKMNLTVVYESAKYEDRYVFSPSGCRIMRRTQYLAELRNKDTVHLFDCVAGMDNEYRMHRAHLVVFSSYNQSNHKAVRD